MRRSGWTSGPCTGRSTMLRTASGSCTSPAPSLIGAAGYSRASWRCGAVLLAVGIQPGCCPARDDRTYVDDRTRSRPGSTSSYNTPHFPAVRGKGPLSRRSRCPCWRIQAWAAGSTRHSAAEVTAGPPLLYLRFKSSSLRSCVPVAGTSLCRVPSRPAGFRYCRILDPRGGFRHLTPGDSVPPQSREPELRRPEG